MTKEQCQTASDMQKGIKYDTGKALLGEMFQDFSIPLEFVARVWEFGANKYGKSNWKYVENARNRYTNALLRHLANETEHEYDKETNLLHAAHVAWNALARLYFIALLHDKKTYQKFLNEVENNSAPGAPAADLENKDILDALTEADKENKSFVQLKLNLQNTNFSDYHSDFNFDT